MYELASLYLANNIEKKNNIKTEFAQRELDLTFCYFPDQVSKVLFEKLSQRIDNDSPENLLSIRKYPFYQMNNSAFYLTDNIILLEKCYTQFINDFWFDKIKKIKDDSEKPVFNIKAYRSIIGNFFELYLNKIIRLSFNNAKYFVIKTFNELDVKIKNQTKELTDVYIRYDNKLFIAEAKSTGIYDKEKYSGNLDDFYKEGREKFFDTFGMSQLVSAISNLHNVVKQFDKGFPENKKVKVFPAVIVNEKALQTPLMAQIFNQRFKELLAIQNAFMFVYPLSIIHISDWENMQSQLATNPKFFWEILKFNTRNPLFIPPFFNSLNRKNIKPDYEEAFALYEELIAQYSKK